MARPYRAFRLCHGASGAVVLPDDYSFMAETSGDRIFTDDYVTLPVNNDAVKIIDDHYEPGSDAGFIQATGANKPAFIAAGHNGLNIVRFDGTNDFMGTTGAEGVIPNGTSLTKMVLGLVIGRTPNVAEGDHAYLSFTNSEGSGTNFVYIKDGGDMESLDVYVNGGYQWNDMPLLEDEWYAIVLTFDADAGAGGEWELYINGVDQGTYAGGAGAAQSVAERIWLMQGFHGVQSGEFGKIVYYEDATADLSDVAGRAAIVSAALMAEWGIS